MLNSTTTIASMIATLIWASAASAGGRAGQFDYYVLALSWSPSWCATTGDKSKADQCDPRHDYGFVLHGLWPQYERGWPSYCPTAKAPPNRQMTREMVDIMGSSGLAWHQWNKHGTCTGLSASAYFAKMRAAFNQIQKPEVLRRVEKPITLPATVVEAAFLEANPALKPDEVTVTCNRGYFQEVRICLTKDLQPRRCGSDVIRDCRQRVTFPPVR